jgi:hypothetical protein
LPYRQQIQLNALTEAHSILRGDNEAKQLDIDASAWLLNWIKLRLQRALDFWGTPKKAGFVLSKICFS